MNFMRKAPGLLIILAVFALAMFSPSPACADDPSEIKAIQWGIANAAEKRDLDGIMSHYVSYKLGELEAYTDGDFGFTHMVPLNPRHRAGRQTLCCARLMFTAKSTVDG